MVKKLLSFNTLGRRLERQKGFFAAVLSEPYSLQPIERAGVVVEDLVGGGSGDFAVDSQYRMDGGRVEVIKIGKTTCYFLMDFANS
jgi:hypothetical protein